MQVIPLVHKWQICSILSPQMLCKGSTPTSTSIQSTFDSYVQYNYRPRHTNQGGFRCQPICNVTTREAIATVSEKQHARGDPYAVYTDRMCGLYSFNGAKSQAKIYHAAKTLHSRTVMRPRWLPTIALLTKVWCVWSSGFLISSLLTSRIRGRYHIARRNTTRV